MHPCIKASISTRPAIIRFVNNCKVTIHQYFYKIVHFLKSMLLHEKGSQERILPCKLTASHSSSARNNLSIFWNRYLRISQSPKHLKETVTFGHNSERKVSTENSKQRPVFILSTVFVMHTICTSFNPNQGEKEVHRVVPFI